MKPRPRSRKNIEEIIGADTEAYNTGEPFLFCFSNGNYHRDYTNIIEYIFSHFENCNIGFYNLKYDAGAVLYGLTKEEKIELWEKNEVIYKRESFKIKIEYIPHKAMILTRGKIRVRIWDIFQYYKTSLNKAALRYLGQGKTDIETKTFLPEYVKKNFRKIKKYCLQDAKLCCDLGNYFIKKIAEFGIVSNALYSGASLSYAYFSDRSRVVNVWRFWKNHPRLLKFALDAYQGGKFEVTARGRFSGYEYDIVSAYPYEIARLYDFSLASIEFNRAYDQEAPYSFYRVLIKNPGDYFLPCGVMLKNVRIYPAGEYYLTITKSEFEYILTLPGVEIEIFEAAHIKFKTLRTPYKSIISDLFSLKSKYKNNDDMLCSISKLMMNSFYGKTCQLIEHHTGVYNAGAAWNPIHAAVITANTRIKVTAIQNRYKEKCIGVHTDSVILLDTMDTAPAPEIGAFDLQYSGEGLILACGMYQIGPDKEAYKGFVPVEDDTWFKILDRHRNQKKFSYPVLKVESWTEAVSKGHFDKINSFSDDTKEIDCNVDIKRTWFRDITAGDLLTGLEQSIPRLHMEHNSPHHWKE
jgi:hypothetical protein